MTWYSWRRPSIASQYCALQTWQPEPSNCSAEVSKRSKVVPEIVWQVVRRLSRVQGPSSVRLFPNCQRSPEFTSVRLLRLSCGPRTITILLSCVQITESAPARLRLRGYWIAKIRTAIAGRLAGSGRKSAYPSARTLVSVLMSVTGTTSPFLLRRVSGRCCRCIWAEVESEVVSQWNIVASWAWRVVSRFRVSAPSKGRSSKQRKHSTPPLKLHQQQRSRFDVAKMSNT